MSAFIPDGVWVAHEHPRSIGPSSEGPLELCPALTGQPRLLAGFRFGGETSFRYLEVKGAAFLASFGQFARPTRGH